MFVFVIRKYERTVTRALVYRFKKVPEFLLNNSYLRVPSPEYIERV